MFEKLLPPYHRSQFCVCVPIQLAGAFYFLWELRKGGKKKMSLGASFKLNFGAQSLMAGSPGWIKLHNIGTGNQKKKKKRRNPPPSFCQVVRVSRWFSRQLSNEPIRSTTSWRAASSALLNRITNKIPIFSLFPFFYFFISYCYNYWILGFREEGRPLERSWIYRIVFLVFSGPQTERTSNSFYRVEMGASNSSSIDLPLIV